MKLKIVGTSYKRRRAVRPLILHPALKGLVWLWVVPREEGGVGTCWEKKPPLRLVSPLGDRILRRNLFTDEKP